MRTWQGFLPGLLLSLSAIKAIKGEHRHFTTLTPALTAVIRCRACQLFGLTPEQDLRAGIPNAEDARAVPRSWAYRHAPDSGFSRAQEPFLQLPLADPVAFLERHEAALGHNARNVINIAHEVGSQHAHSAPAI